MSTININLPKGTEKIISEFKFMAKDFNKPLTSIVKNNMLILKIKGVAILKIKEAEF